MSQTTPRFHISRKNSVPNSLECVFSALDFLAELRYATVNCNRVRKSDTFRACKEMYYFSISLLSNVKNLVWG